MHAIDSIVSKIKIQICIVNFSSFIYYFNHLWLNIIALDASFQTIVKSQNFTDFFIHISIYWINKTFKFFL